MGARDRDNQRSKVYRAEHEFYGPKGFSKDAADFKTVEECLEFAQKILRDPKVVEAYPSATQVAKTIEVKPGQGKRKASAEFYGTVLKLPLWSRRKWVICHEVAHLLVGPPASAHGWQFVECYLLLVRREISPEASEGLRKTFKQWKVRYTPPRAKRTFTEEQRQVLRERMQGVNKARRRPEGS